MTRLTSASSGDRKNITMSDSTSRMTLPLMIGSMLSSACTSAESEFAPGHELTGRHLVEAREVHGLEVVVHVVAQIVLHLEADPAAAIAPKVGETEGGEGEDDEQHEPGRSGEVFATMTPSTICRAMRGTTTWHALPSRAATREMITLRRCRSMYRQSRRTQPTGRGAWLSSAGR